MTKEMFISYNQRLRQERLPQRSRHWGHEPFNWKVIALMGERSNRVPYAIACLEWEDGTVRVDESPDLEEIEAIRWFEARAGVSVIDNIKLSDL